MAAAPPTARRRAPPALWPAPRQAPRPGQPATPRNVASILHAARKLGIRDAHPTDIVQFGSGHRVAAGGGQRRVACPSRIRCQAATGSWTKSRQWETERTLFSSTRATHVSAGEGQQRVALQRRVAAYLAVIGQTPGATQRCLNPGFSERIGNSRRTRWRIGRRQRCATRLLRQRSPAQDQGADGPGAWTCGNLAAEIPTSPHPSSIHQYGDDLNFDSPGSCPNKRGHLRQGVCARAATGYDRETNLDDSAHMSTTEHDKTIAPHQNWRFSPCLTGSFRHSSAAL